MEHMGGGIACRTELGEFTEFTLTFPHPETGDRQ
jgi:two-component system CAI-1 autoinducer sensor kinase/phosphatase CqsS